MFALHASPAAPAVASIGVGAIGSLSSAGVGAVLGLIAIMLRKYDTQSKVQAWLFMLSGLFLTGTIAPYIAGLAGRSILGLGVAVAALIVSGFMFWFEGHQGQQSHRTKTNVASFVFGLTLTMTGFLGISAILTHLTTSVLSAIPH